MSESISDQAAEPDVQGRPKRARRTRKDCDERTFVCKYCLKTYLSNAALYTHVKNKHQTEKKQGSQQKLEKQPDQKGEPQNGAFGSQALLESKQLKSEGVDLNSSALEQLRQYIKKYYPQRNKGCTIRLICQGLPPQILEYMQPILREGSQLRTLQLNKMKTTVSQVFGIFLTLMNLRVSSTCINFLIRFFYYFHIALKQQTKKHDYCQKQNASNLPNYFNNIILHGRIPTAGYDEDQMMHNPTIICKVFQYFGLWLYDQRYTDYQAIANFPEEI